MPDRIKGERDIAVYFREVVLPYESDECLFWPHGNNHVGYGTIRHHGKVLTVSRAVCEEIHSNPPTPKHEAAHSCGNGHLGCCNKRHLSWKTRAGNQADRVIHGTSNRGERSARTILTEADVRTIRSLKGIKSQRMLAGEFGVAKETIAGLHRRTNWGWLED